MARTIAAYRTYLGWDVFHERHHTGLHWTARSHRNGDKFRAERLADLKAAIRAWEDLYARTAR